ncbi:MAG: hypothetical protein DRR19_26515, partial [Candidatus Parabeggiatoa sp. nov. 1]
MPAKKDFSQIQDYMIQILPQLLRQQPEIVTTIEGIIAHQFPRRDEFARLLDKFDHVWDEIKLQREEGNLLREENNRLREESNRLHEQNEQQIKLLREENNLLHEEINLHREESNRQIEQNEQEIKLLREEMNQRFDKVDKRFDKVEQSLDKQHHDIIDIKRRMIKVETTVLRTNEKITLFDAWLKIVTGNLGTEKGQKLEELFALGLSYGLKTPDIKPETIQLRQLFVDTEGSILRKGKYVEIDLIAENGKFTVFEVKTTAVTTDVSTFARKVQLVQRQNPDKQVEGVF